MLSTLERSDLKNFQPNALTSSPVALERPLGVMPELLEADIPLNSLHRASDGLGSIPEPNNTLGQAYNIGVLSGTRSFTDFVGSSDTNDYYRFSLNGTSNFTLNLSGLSADADVEVIRDGNGNLVRDAYEVIGASTNGGASPESIILRGLAAGVYYVRVNPYGGASTNYSLRLTAASGLGVAPEPNNNLSQAYTISPATHPWIVQAYLNGTRQFSGWVGSTDINDYYRFNLGTPSNINLALTGMGADADLLVIHDANNNLIVDPGEVIASSSWGGTHDEAINLADRPVGTYFVQVYQYSGNTNYRLSLSTLKPSNLLPVETNIGTLSGLRSFSDRVDTTDTADVFRFAIGGTRNVNLILTGMSADADLRLIRDVNSNGLVDSGDEIVRSIRGSNSPEWISRSLGAGTYFAQVYQYSGNTNYNLRLFALGDMGIGNLLQSAASDYNVSRNETIGILRNAKDGGVIDSTELSELRTIVAETRPFMANYVFNLSNKLVNGDPANAWWTGGAATRTALGNLVPGSSATQMERLIGKWFLGLDRPTASSNTTYRLASGSLFQSGISYSDIDQGNLGDCYLLASLAGTAFRSSSTIQNMFIDNGDGTYTVRFYRGGVADYVTVDRYLPTYSSGSLTGRFYYANRDSGRLYNDSANELWVALAERAYAQINESGWIGQDNINRYQSPDELLDTGIDGGTLAAISHITGLSNTGYISPLNTSELIRAYNANRITYLSDGGHAYTLVGYNSSTGIFTVYNPHGHPETYTNAQMLATFVRFGYSGSRV